MTTAVHRVSISLPELEQLAQKILLTLAWPVWDEPLPWCQQAFPVPCPSSRQSLRLPLTPPTRSLSPTLSFCSHDHSPDRALFSQIRLFARSHARVCDGPDSGAEPQSCPPAPCGMDTIAHGCCAVWCLVLLFQSHSDGVCPVPHPSAQSIQKNDCFNIS